MFTVYQTNHWSYFDEIWMELKCTENEKHQFHGTNWWIHTNTQKHLDTNDLIYTNTYSISAYL